MRTPSPSLSPRPSTTSARLNKLRQRLPRMADWWLMALCLAVLVWALAPHQLAVSIYKLSLVSMAGVVGYWLDRSLFPYARPDTFFELGAVDQPADEPEFGADPHDPQQGLLVCAPDDQLLRLCGLCMLRRAIIVAASMVAVSLGA